MAWLVLPSVNDVRAIAALLPHADDPCASPVNAVWFIQVCGCNKASRPGPRRGPTQAAREGKARLVSARPAGWTFRLQAVCVTLPTPVPCARVPVPLLRPRDPVHVAEACLDIVCPPHSFPEESSRLTSCPSLGPSRAPQVLPMWTQHFGFQRFRQARPSQLGIRACLVHAVGARWGGSLVAGRPGWSAAAAGLRVIYITLHQQQLICWPAVPALPSCGCSPGECDAVESRIVYPDTSSSTLVRRRVAAPASAQPARKPRAQVWGCLIGTAALPAWTPLRL